MWLVDSVEHAEFVRNFPTEWFNAGYETPSHDFESDDLEVVSVEIVVNTQKVDVSIPTVYEFYERRYSTKDKKHWEHLKGLIEEGKVESYSYWDLIDYLKNKE